MDFCADLRAIYTELTDDHFDLNTGAILLRDDGDGVAYISIWKYSKPIPNGFTLGKPTA